MSAPCAPGERAAGHYFVSNIVYLSAMLPRARQRLIHSRSGPDREVEGADIPLFAGYRMDGHYQSRARRDA
jgi:hypothetical protein